MAHFLDFLDGNNIDTMIKNRQLSGESSSTSVEIMAHTLKKRENTCRYGEKRF